eukprot:TRINITY_DN16849_c0_g2_i1.p1 TRINITY_DN16849_c0_g2~~TRINITY_DN16849_c0_g2_i1.p1  ORF type:complete len:183 (+),score=57.80 TRINITY_DN16849_c0_g2_i1:71-550(+)
MAAGKRAAGAQKALKGAPESALVKWERPKQRLVKTNIEKKAAPKASPTKAPKAAAKAPALKQAEAEEGPTGGQLALATRGSGRGLKAVQTMKDTKTSMRKTCGAEIDTEMSVKEMRVFTARGNAHVESKKETLKKQTTKKNCGTVITKTSSVTSKVMYM